MKKESQEKKNQALIKSKCLKLVEEPPNLLSTLLDEQLAAMGALIEPLPCRFDCDHEYETAVSSGTQEV
ncbi:hypothetical protein TNCT_616541 [Trichonephila clavata]|uniref:Uncharacterized protein n=1 Tax=Trichonephila clavata TaxID=2740835 RepID=A0A8X6L8Y5_TRICU|nr:hypothetical protein TNCT_616541 [Trichonephila clavata]